MPNFSEQLAAIAKLRAEARQHEESLYGARVQLRKLQQRRERAGRGQTVPVPERDAEVARLRAQMAQLNALLARLREEEREVSRQLEQITEQERVVARLAQSLIALRNRIAALRRRRAELQQQDSPPREEIDQITAEIEALTQAQEELERAIREGKEKLEELREREEELRERQESVRGLMESARADLRGLQDRIAELLQPGFDDREAIDRGISQLEGAVERSRNNVGRVANNLAAAIVGLYAVDPHPRRPLTQLDDRTPFLLFPVRIETIFATVPSPRGVMQTELQVRVYPDEIVVHTHEATLTDREVDAGRLYWVELLVAAYLRSQKEPRQADAWRHLVNLFGGQRAAWIARNTKPSDWDTLSKKGEKESLVEFLHGLDAAFFTNLLALSMPAGVHTRLQKAVADRDGDAFMILALEQNWGERINAVVRNYIMTFPAADLTRTDAWSRAPRTRLLPDRFVLLLYRTEDSAPQEIVGNLIPDTVTLGPDPLEPGKTFVTEAGVLTLGGSCKWMSHFETAVAEGLGFRVLLTEEQANAGFARIVVLGVWLSASADESAQMLEELIGNHQFSPKGFSLVPQGTPTNNTERNGTGYSDNDPYDDLAFFTELDPPAFDPESTDPLRSQTDGRLLADALGISYSTLQTVQHAEQTDVLEARAMNRAIFPATLGYWLKNWVSPLVTPAAARLTRDFFTQQVTGRGPLPAIRVGNQPYGVLVTSDMSRWRYAEREGPFAAAALFDEMTPYLRKLHELLFALEKQWTAFAGEVAHVGKPGSEPADTLMKVLGLHPNSVEFYQRIGYHEQYLHSLDNFTKEGGRYTQELNALIFSMPAMLWQYLQGLGINANAGELGKNLSMRVLWQHYVAGLDVPNLVENKPPSEVNTLAFNYIEWLAKAESVGKIVLEQFSVEKPAALLYLMLRNAVLLQLHHGSYEWLASRADFAPALTTALKPAALANVRASSPNVSRFELMAVHVESAQPSHAVPGTSVADWLWTGPTAAEVEGAFVKAQRMALEQLAKAPTARLERALIEHLDCCQYRLDAWETGLFAQRLQSQRGSRSPYLDRRTGIYLGAFGWVEDVRRTPRVVMRKEELPAVLRSEDDGPVLEEDEVATTSRMAVGSKRGGFTHAPSINHAAAAALLRNAYLSHANSEQADALSNNLSSDRVRRAEFVLEGMRNGQPLEALLGYQFERALHDRTSESAARGDALVLELNQFIQPYRTAFPFQSKEIPQAGTEPAAETVPPYSVVNGLTLMQATLDGSNGYGLQAVLTAPELPNASQGAAIVAVKNSLIEAVDAVKDLLMAENAYQLVQGNFDRVAAVSLAQKDARIPPSLDVISTPRGAQFTFTNRVTLHFDDLDPSLPASNPWPDIPITPRARMEPGLNFWLGTLLGRAPKDVRCRAGRVEEGEEDLQDPDLVTLVDLGIQPIDFIALTGINVTETQGGATELETRVAFYYRDTHGLAPDANVRIDFDPEGPASQLTFGQLFPLARRLRSLLGECRSLSAQDFLPSSGGKASAVPVDKNNPGGYDVADLRARVQAVLGTLTGLANALDSAAAPTVTLVLKHNPADPGDDETVVGTLGLAFAKLDETGFDLSDTAAVEITFSSLAAETLRSTLNEIALYGIIDAFVPEVDITSDAAKRALLSRAQRVARRLRRAEPKVGVLDRANALIAAATTDKPIADQASSLLQAGQMLFADSLKLLPQFVCYNEVDLAASDAARAQLLSHALSLAPGLSATEIVDEWLQGLARLRPRLQMFETMRALAESLNDVDVDARPVQVPYRNQDRWLAVEFPEKDPLDATKRFGISRDTLSICAHGASAFQAGVAQRGLLIDEWKEEIPTESETTGISFRFNQPNAVPPQTLLLAVTPEETGSWSWDDLVGTLIDTLARAKRRAVEPAQLEKTGVVWNALALATVSEFSTLPFFDVSLDVLVAVQYEPLKQFYTGLQKP